MCRGIRFKIMTTILVSLSIMGAGIMLASHLAVEHEFLHIQQETMRADLDRVHNILNHEVDDLIILARDYAQWDDTWLFVHGDYPEYARVNLVEATFRNAELSGFLVSSPSARVLHAWGALQGAAADVLLNKVLRAGPGSGFLSDGTKLHYFARLPVANSSGSQVSPAVLVMMRAMDETRQNTMVHKLGMSFSLLPANPSQTGKQLSLANGMVYGRMLMYDFQGNPLAQLAIEYPARIVTKASDFVFNIMAMVAFVVVLVGMLMLFLLNRMVLQPIAGLGKLAGELNVDQPQLPERIIVQRVLGSSREFSSLGDMFFDMATRLIQHNAALAERNVVLKEEVDVRFGQLVSANKELILYQKVMEGTSEGIVITSLDGTILETNEAMSRMTGYTQAELLGQNPRMMKSGRHDGEFYKTMWAAINRDGHWIGEVWDRKKDGTLYPKWLSINRINDDTGEPIRYIGLSSDISRIKAAEERLNQLAFYDSLTGLPNRTLFNDRLVVALGHAQRNSSRMALLFMDLDRFKVVNDTMGHAIGDELLVEVSVRLQAAVRNADTVSRLGGDEFTIVLENLSRSEEAALIATKIIKSLSNPFVLRAQHVYVGASIGISVFPFDGTNAEDLVKKADTAMYKAKENGRNRYRFFAGSMDSESMQHLQLEAEMRQAIAEERFEPYFQPQAACGGMQPGQAKVLIGTEALARWIRADGSVVNPASFIPLAEETGLIGSIGMMLLQKSCKEACHWADSGTPLKVSVNVSGLQFEAGDLPDIVYKVLQDTGLNPRLLMLEVTESLFMKKLDPIIRQMNDIRAMGVRFAIDDFGTGFSSLQYLHRLPLDSLKIDKVFVDDIHDSLDGGEIVTAIISMARSFGLSSIAEGVETMIQLDALRKRGCDEIQGYLLGKPMDAKSFRSFIGIV